MDAARQLNEPRPMKRGTRDRLLLDAPTTMSKNIIGSFQESESIIHFLYVDCDCLTLLILTSFCVNDLFT